MQCNLLLFLDGCQGLRQDVGAGLAKPALARTAKVVRCVIQRHQHAGLLVKGGVVREIVAGQIGKRKVTLGGKFPSHVQLNVCGHSLCARHQFKGCGLLEFQQHVGALDLEALAGVQLDLGRSVCLREDAPGQELAGFFK